MTPAFSSGRATLSNRKPIAEGFSVPRASDQTSFATRRRWSDDVGVGRHEYKKCQANLAGVFDAMLHAGWRQYDRLGTELLLFGTDPERAAALQHYVNFVRVLVRMDSLPLTRLQTIHVAKQLVGLAQIDLGHSLAGESHCFSDVLKNHAWISGFFVQLFFQHHTPA